MSIYALKPRFQTLLRPLVHGLAGRGVTANQVTLAACGLSLLLGLYLGLAAPPRAAFALVPVWMLARMAFNAVDGMLAREHGQASALGAFLNELTDVVSDTALYLPFAHVAPFDPFWVVAVALLASWSEYAGALGTTVGASRRYDGPMGKSDRAFVFGALGLYVSLNGAMPQPVGLLMPAVAALTAWTLVRRIRMALIERAMKQARQ